MGKPGYLTAGYVIKAGNTSADIQPATTKIVHVGKHNIFFVTGRAAASGGRMGAIRIRGTNEDPLINTDVTDWPLVDTINVTAAKLNGGSNTPFTGIEYLYIHYEWTAGGAADELFVYVTKKVQQG